MKTFIQTIKIGAIFSTLVLLGLSGCKCTHQDKEASKQLTLAESNDSFPYPGIVFLLPSPSEVLFTTYNNDIAFNSNLTAPKDLEKKTIISQQQALILGVYITDLSYNILYKNHQDGINTISSIEVLAQNLGIGSLLNDRYFQRIENNISNLDSIDAIFIDFSQNSFSTLEETGNNEVLSLVAMGSGIEAMYLINQSIDFKTITDAVLPNFIGQKVIYENYFKNFLNYNHSKPELKTFIHDIQCIYNLFERNVAVKSYSTVTGLENSHFDIKDRTETTSFSEKGIRALGDSIVIVRNNLVNLKYQ